MNFFNRIHQLPLYWLGYKNLPAFPIEVSSWIGTLLKLLGRGKETTQAKNGLSKTFTIQSFSASGYDFLFSDKVEKHKENKKKELVEGMKNNLSAAVALLHTEILKNQENGESLNPEEPLSALSLDEPEQFALSLTTFDGIYDEAKPFFRDWSAALKDPDEANRQFWPMIAHHGLAYNLLILEKLSGPTALSAKKDMADVWDNEIETAYQEGNLYRIDMRIFNQATSAKMRGFERFTPATVTLLKRDPQTKALTPFVVTVSNYEDQSKQTYRYGVCSSGSWIYALQAARTAITVYGIIMGHLYQWHLVTAAMQTTMKNHLSDGHPVSKLLLPQSEHLTGFNNILLLIWSSIAPPTSVASSRAFLTLVNNYANGRTFFDDDPKVKLKKLGIEARDFTLTEEWDLYPIVKIMLRVWNATEKFVSSYVQTMFTDDGIAGDKDLQKWMAASANPKEGNLKGLPEVKDKESLIRVLTSIVYRVSMHGASRLRTSDTPAFTFVANFPPCLQSSVLPDPQKPLPTRELLTYLPKTGTIGEMLDFIYIFVFSSPYTPLIPKGGIDADLWFTDEACNNALITFRKVIQEVIIERYGAYPPQIFQWPLNIET